MTRVFYVVDVDFDFKGNMSEAAIWLEDHLAHSTFHNKVVAYRSLEDLTSDAADKEGAFTND